MYFKGHIMWKHYMKTSIVSKHSSYNNHNKMPGPRMLRKKIRNSSQGPFMLFLDFANFSPVIAEMHCTTCKASWTIPTDRWQAFLASHQLCCVATFFPCSIFRVWRSKYVSFVPSQKLLTVKENLQAQGHNFQACQVGCLASTHEPQPSCSFHFATNKLSEYIATLHSLRPGYCLLSFCSFAFPFCIAASLCLPAHSPWKSAF